MTLIGVLGYALQGYNVLELVRFERTGGFGRTFVVGLAWTAGCLMLLLLSALKKLRSMKNGSGSEKGKNTPSYTPRSPT